MLTVKKFSFCIFFLFLFGFQQAIAQKKKSIKDYIVTYHKNDELSFRDSLELKMYLDKLFDKQELLDPTAQIFYLITFGKGWLQLPNSSETIAKRAFDKATALVTSLNNTSFELWTKVNIGYAYYKYRKISKALPYFLQADALYDRSNGQELLDKEDLFKKMGFFFGTLGETDKAIHLLQKATNYSKDQSNEQAALLDNLGVYYLHKSDTLAATQLFERAKAIARKNGDYIRIGKVLGNMAILLEEQGHVERAINYLKQDIQYSQQYGDTPNTIHASLQLANLYTNNDNIPAAKKILTEINPLLQRKENLVTFYKKSLDLELLIAKREGDSQTELSLRRELDILLEKEKLWDGEEVVKNSQWTARQQDFTQQLQSNKAVIDKERNTKKIYMGIALLLSCIIVGLYFFFRRKNRAEKKRFEQKIHKLQVEKKTNSIHLPMDETDNIRSLPHVLSPQTPYDPSIKKIENKTHNLTLWSLLLNGHLMTEESWEEFMHLYEMEYPKFLKSISTDFPEIKGSGLRCVLLLKLGLSNKEAARLLGVSPDSIKKTRQRLRYKIDEKKYKRLLKMISISS